jgi:hypothetical protein
MSGRSAAWSRTRLGRRKVHPTSPFRNLGSFSGWIQEQSATKDYGTREAGYDARIGLSLS